MTKSELITKVSEQVPGLSKVQTEIIVDAFFNSITVALQNDEKVEIRGFGNFKVKRRNSRTARNPKTGEQVEVPRKKVLHFKVGKELREMMNNQKGV
ncbi:MAG: integration host factor subunit beta [Candidatus Magnetoovum sp. WYHC-5]|nr:integration host factor subunit beta [Candidatus Magnetoovum sp. WYHC-5]